MFKAFIDWRLVIPAVLLLLIGITVLSSINPQLVGTQLLFIAASIGVFLFYSFLDHQLTFSLSGIMYLAFLVFMLAPFVFGSDIRGAYRWIPIGQFSLQPSELAKPFLLAFFARLAASDRWYRHLLLVTALLIPSLIIFLQPDLGTALVLSAGWITVFVSRMPLRSLGLFAGLVILLLPLSWLVLKPYQKDRLFTFVDPSRDPLGRGYHVIQSIISVGSGQFLGRGLGHGTQSQLKFLPERHTDFIFASLSEELGFVGGMLVIVLFLAYLNRIYHVSQCTQSLTQSLFCLSAMSMLAFQILVNLSMNLGLAPVTGVTLPFISYGGSSLLSLAITTGLVNSISADCKNAQKSI